MSYIEQTVNFAQDISNIHKQLHELYELLSMFTGSYTEEEKKILVCFNSDITGNIYIEDYNNKNFTKSFWELDPFGNVTTTDDGVLISDGILNIFELDIDGNLTTTSIGHATTAYCFEINEEDNIEVIDKNNIKMVEKSPFVVVDNCISPVTDDEANTILEQVFEYDEDNNVTSINYDKDFKYPFAYCFTIDEDLNIIVGDENVSEVIDRSPFTIIDNQITTTFEVENKPSIEFIFEYDEEGNIIPVNYGKDYIKNIAYDFTLNKNNEIEVGNIKTREAIEHPFFTVQDNNITTSYEEDYVETCVEYDENKDITTDNCDYRFDSTSAYCFEEDENQNIVIGYNNNEQWINRTPFIIVNEEIVPISKSELGAPIESLFEFDEDGNLMSRDYDFFPDDGVYCIYINNIGDVELGWENNSRALNNSPFIIINNDITLVNQEKGDDIHKVMEYDQYGTVTPVAYVDGTPICFEETTYNLIVSHNDNQSMLTNSPFRLIDKYNFTIADYDEEGTAIENILLLRENNIIVDYARMKPLEPNRPHEKEQDDIFDYPTAYCIDNKEEDVIFENYDNVDMITNVSPFYSVSDTEISIDYEGLHVEKIIEYDENNDVQFIEKIIANFNYPTAYCINNKEEDVILEYDNNVDMLYNPSPFYSVSDTEISIDYEGEQIDKMIEYDEEENVQFVE